MDPRQRSYHVLALAQAVLGGIIAAGVFLVYRLKPDTLQDTATTLISASMGLFVLAYHFSLHQLLKRRFLGLSAALITALTIANLVLVIAQTGGLDSPFYSFWLLVIVASGVFGAWAALITMSATTAYFIFEMAGRGFESAYVTDHVIQLGVTIAAGALAELVYWRSKRASRTHQQVASLSGQLGEEQLKGQAILEAMADGVVVVDRGLNIQLFNHAAAEYTGWSQDEALGLSYRSVFKLKTTGDQDLTDENDPFQASWREGKPVVRNDLILVSRKEKKSQLTVSVTPLVTNGQSTGAIAVFRDISAEKEIERQRNEFISTASHEMRTPVAAIEGYIALAVNPKVATIDDRARGFLEKAHQNTQHLGALFRDLLSITKLEENAVKQNPVPVELGQVVKDIVTDLQMIAVKKNLTLAFNPSAAVQGGKTISPLFTVKVDPERIREVLTNLIDNALKFTTEGGVTVTITGDEKSVTVSVADTGPGINPEDIKHLFQKFYRIDSSATRTVGGTGLGLYLCRQIIELYGGRIWAESQPGKGSVFFFTLPRADNALLAQPAQAPVAPVQPSAIPMGPTPPPAAPVQAPSPVPAGPTGQPPVAAIPVQVARAKL